MPNFRAISSALSGEETASAFGSSAGAPSSSSSSAAPPADFLFNPALFKACPGFVSQSPDFIRLQSLTYYYDDDRTDPARLPKRNFLIFGVSPLGRIAQLRACRDLALNARSIARAVTDEASIVMTMDANMNYFSEYGLVRVEVFCFFVFFFQLRAPTCEKKKKKSSLFPSSLSSSSSTPI